MKIKATIATAGLFLLCLQWPLLRFLEIPLPPVSSALSSGLAIFGAAYVLSWGGELAQMEIPQSLAIAFLALVAVLPEYAVDLYFAWQAGRDPAYVHFATANMTGSNRLLIGAGWAAVAFAYYVKKRRGEIALSEGNRVEIMALILATLYSLVIPAKGTLSWVDSAFFLAIFVLYIRRASQSHHEEPELEGPMEAVGRWPRGRRILVTAFLFVFSGAVILLSAKPFAEGLLDVGRHLGIEPFLLVQWLAPLASEAPEFIVAVLFALRARPEAGLGTLISSKVNQWTLLVGMVPLAYAVSAGRPSAMPLDARQVEEIFLTSAQSFFALAVIVNLRFSITEALLIFILFATQIFFPSTEARTVYAFIYLALGLGWLFVVRGQGEGLKQVFRKGAFSSKITHT
ncbi:MAG TPA: sodium:calcium antiporter [bacterium]|nr:sodium:calcium antiporter [bacterium]